MALSWRFWAVTDIGPARKKNDDSAYAGPHFIVVADGMGGAPAGDLASAVAVQTLRRLDVPDTKDMLEALAGALNRANDRLGELIDEDTAVAGMGTTVTAVLFDGKRIGVAHLGDSRGYLWRAGELLRITADHTWVQSLIDDGRITEDEAKVHSHRSLLLKVLDGRHDNKPDLSVYDVEVGDRILLCSDGLSGFVDADRMQRVLSVGTPDAVARELTQLALEAGSTDNVTVVVADIVEEETTTNDPVIVGAVAQPPRGAVRRLRTWGQRDETPTGKLLMADPDVDPEELRYAPRPPQRFLGLRRFAVVLAVLAVAAAAGYGIYYWSQQQYYVAAYGDQVAIYQGVQENFPGLQLHHVYEAGDVGLSELPSFRRSQVVEGMTADNLESARRIVTKLETFALVCAQQASETTALATTAIPTGPPTTAPARATTTTPTDVPAPVRRTADSAPKPPVRTSTTAPTRGEARPPTQQTPASPTSRRAESTAGAAAPEECAGATPATGTAR